MEALTALFQVIALDLVLAGDNAVVIGLAAAGLPDMLRVRAVLFGMAAATALRLIFAVMATQLLQLTGLVLAGGILLLWVSWKMLRELYTPPERHADPTELITSADFNADDMIVRPVGQKTFGQAAGQIVLADVSMSLDNVLAVAGAARDHVPVMVVGLLISIALMGAAASVIARILQRHRWVAYLGLAMIVYVALEMIHHGAGELWPVVVARVR